GVACGIMSRHRHLQPHRVLIAIGAHLVDGLEIAGGFALLPDRLARSAVIMRNPAFDRQRQSLCIHMRDHQQFAIGDIGDDSRDEAIGVEERGEGARAFLLCLACRGGWESLCHAGLQRLRTRLRKRAWSLAFVLKSPVKVVVSVVAPCFWIPRMAMHMCSASIITATPRGFSVSLIAAEICAVMFSCVCRRRPNISTTRAIFDSPSTRPFGR